MNETSRPEVTVSAGEVLKRLRQEKQMSVHDVAVKLYLDPWIIEALEENDFSRLPAATYSRGYLRSYAKLVDADADHLIALYDNNAPEPPEIIPEVKHPTQISSSDKPVKAITWMISLLLALLLISWIHSIYMVPVEDQPPAADTPTETTPAGDVEFAPPVEETVSEPPASDVPLPEPEAAPVTAETEAQAPESMLPENTDANSPAAGEPPAGEAP